MLRKLVLGVVLAACLASVAVAADGPLTISGDERLGSFRVRADGTLGGAIGAFGAPTRIRRTSDSSCTASWRPLGLTIDLYNLGGGDACSKRDGLFLRAVARAPRWRTSKGLRVGDPVARLRQLYPAAKLHRGLRSYWPAGWWLLPRPELYGTGGTYPALLAETRAGRVVGFHVRYQSGGD